MKTKEIKQAKKRWLEAKKYLEKGDLRRFLAKNHQFYDYVSAKKLGLSDLQGIKENINDARLKELCILRQCVNFYASQTHYLYEELEGFLGKVNYHDENYIESFSPYNSNYIDKHITLMQYLQKDLKGEARDLIKEKIAQLQHLDRSHMDVENSIKNILTYKDLDKEQKKVIHKYYKKRPDFFHTCAVQAHDELREKYHGLRGDTLKTRILADFTTELQKSREQKQFIDEFRKSAEFKILQKGQGLTTCLLQKTWFFGKKTTSEKAVDKIYEAVTKSSPYW